MTMENDIDQNLLLQFSCMGTTDKDELIKQLQTILGFQLNSSTATFFLEMNNWNLQGAVGSYFDANQSLNLPSMMLLRNYSVVDDEIRVHPGSWFFKTWEVENNGKDPWPSGCLLVFTGGQQMSIQGQLPVPILQPGYRANIRMDMIAPQEPGIYESKWRMSTSTGSYFGDVIWMNVTVADQMLNGLTDQLSSMSSLGATAASPETSACNLYTNASHNKPQEQQTPNMDEDGNMIL